MDGSLKPPQISEMFQKFALAFKTKTFELFADGDETAVTEDADGSTLLDSAEEFITDQKVVVVKPDCAVAKSALPVESADTQFIEALVSSLFATISSFEASYLQLQTAHVPFDEETVKTADRALVSHLQRLSDVRKCYRNLAKNANLGIDFTIGSCLESRVQENQSKLRSLETLVNRLQSDIDTRDNEVLRLRQQLEQIQKANSNSTKRLYMNSNSNISSAAEVLLTVRVFDSMFREACRALHSFTKLLIELMKKSGWDLDLAATSVHPNVDYAKKGHTRYVFLSYVSMGMFQGFNSECFGLGRNGDSQNLDNNSAMRQLLEHSSCNPLEVLSKKPNCGFSKFCERKYRQLIHPTIESSIFGHFDSKGVVLGSWGSLSVFYELFVKMASSVWLLHKLAYSFNPSVQIFQLEKGVDFSMVYMEDVTKRGTFPAKSRPVVAFTAVPGFKIGKTVIQAQVYLKGLKRTHL